MLGRDWKLSRPAFRLNRRGPLARTSASFFCSLVLGFEIDPKAGFFRPKIFVHRSGGPALGVCFLSDFLAPTFRLGMTKIGMNVLC